MSHFTVLVVTANGTDEEVAAALAPYHEFECTGEDDQYVQNIDLTAEAREQFEKDTTIRYKDLEGRLHCPCDKRFYRDPTAEEKEARDVGPRDTKVHFLPEGWEKVEVKSSEVESFACWAAEQHGLKVIKERIQNEDTKYGWVLVDGSGEVVEVIDRTNPNAKWDWWVVGGRWPNRLLSRTGTKVNSLRKGELDVDTIRANAGAEAAVEWDRIRGIVGDLADFVPWGKARDMHPGNIAAAREFYHDQPARQAMHQASMKDRGLAFIELEPFMASREDYVQRGKDMAIEFFALLKDGEWKQRGDMGWWGAVSNVNGDWTPQFNALFEAIPDSCWLTVVDCHI